MKKVLNILLAFVAFTSGVGAYHFTEVQDFTVDFVSQFEEEKVELSASVIKEEFVQKEQEMHSVAQVELEKKKYERDGLTIDLPESFDAIAREVLSSIPESQTRSLTRIIGEHGKDAKRGLASFKSMYIGIDNIETDEEFRRVFIHELGHILDLGGLKASSRKIDSGFRDGSNVIYNTDASLDFYTLCWDTEHDLSGQCSDLDFVSEYAQADSFEDFAESYLLFVENNESFVEMAKESEVLQKKYNFFAETVFNGKFENTAKAELPKEDRVWDLTKVY